MASNLILANRARTLRVTRDFPIEKSPPRPRLYVRTRQIHLPPSVYFFLQSPQKPEIYTVEGETGENGGREWRWCHGEKQKTWRGTSRARRARATRGKPAGLHHSFTTFSFTHASKMRAFFCDYDYSFVIIRRFLI